jgi:hypothetical protein
VPVGLELALLFLGKKVLDVVVGSLAKEGTDALRRRLLGDETQRALAAALGAAVAKYRESGLRLELAEPLLGKHGVLADDEVAAELGQLLSFEAEPHASALARRWRSAVPDAPDSVDFDEEAARLLQLIAAELRRSPQFRPVFDSRRLDAIASGQATSIGLLTDIEAELRNLSAMMTDGIGEMVSALGRAPQGVREHVRDATALLEDKTRGFVGRRFVFDALDSFLARTDSGYFFLRGDPGIGKSALAAQVTRERGCVHHFNVRAEGVNTAAAFLTNTCAQLIGAYGLPRSELPADVAEDGGTLGALLGEAAVSARGRDGVLVVVDAIDEADLASSRGGNPLFLPVSLPSGVHLLVTQRKTPVKMRVDGEAEAFDIDPTSPENRSDIIQYLEGVTARPEMQDILGAASITPGRFVKELANRSAGNFMYLRYVLPEIERGRYRGLDVSELPAGLDNYYEDHWRRLRGEDEDAWFKWRLPVLTALAVAESPVSAELVARLSGIDEVPRVRRVLADWQQFLHVGRQIFDEREVRTYSIYHASFREFLARKEEVADERVSLGEASRRAASAFSELFDD